MECFLYARLLVTAVLCALLVTFYGCSTPARSEKMVPAEVGIAKKHPYSVRIIVTGGQDNPPVGRPQITNSAFREALVDSIIRSGVFSRIVEDPNASNDYLLVVTLFSMDKLVFRNDVKMEAGWTLRRPDGRIIWQEAIVTESTGNVIVGTELAARDNIAQALGKISKLSL
jgi:hypothetical protein